MQLRLIDEGEKWDEISLNLLGVRERKTLHRTPPGSLPVEAVRPYITLPPGQSLIHFCVWKYIIIHMTKLSIHGTPFSTDAVLAQARRRVRKRLDFARQGLRIIAVAAEAKGREPSAPQYKKWLQGIGTVEHGALMKLTEEVARWLVD